MRVGYACDAQVLRDGLAAVSVFFGRWNKSFEPQPNGEHEKEPDSLNPASLSWKSEYPVRRLGFVQHHARNGGIILHDA